MKSVFLILSLFLLEGLLLEGRNCYLFEKLNAKKKIEQGDNLQIRYQVVGTPIWRLELFNCCLLQASGTSI